MKAYSIFAQVYDEFMKDIPYEEWYEKIKEKLPRSGKILELGCGSGNFTTILAEQGYEIMGIDISEEMLHEAIGKKIPRTRFVSADMTEFDFSEQYDAAVCLCDGMNYLTCDMDLENTFKCVAKHLKSGGVFVFDLKKEKYFEELSDSTFSDEIDRGRYVWENYYDSETKDNVYMLTFFIRKWGNMYRKYEEQHLQHVFFKETVERVAKDCDMTLIQVIDDDIREFYVLERK